jgi:nitrogen fixation protein NifU and related proteins
METINDKYTKYFGRLNDPTSSAFIKGPCGDEMEFYLVIENDKIQDIRFYTTGCEPTIMCASVVAENTIGKTIYDGLGIFAKEVMDVLQDLPADHKHCSILAVTTFYRACADYLLKS